MRLANEGVGMFAFHPPSLSTFGVAPGSCSRQIFLSCVVLQNLSILRIFYFFAGELCGMEERDGRHVLHCAWARVKRVLSDYDFASWSTKEQVSASIDFASNIASFGVCFTRHVGQFFVIYHRP